jgi:hypothetical protein
MLNPSPVFFFISGFSPRKDDKPAGFIESFLYENKHKLIFAIKKKGLLTRTSILVHSARFVSLTALG